MEYVTSVIKKSLKQEKSDPNVHAEKKIWKNKYC